MQKWTEVPAGQVNGAFQRFMGALGDEADIAIARINTEPVFADRMAVYARNGGVEVSVSQVRAREIMGTNFFGIEEAMKHFGVNPSRRQIAVLGEVPFSEEVLTACKDTHVLVAVFPISIVEIRSKVTGVKLPNDQPLFYKQDLYDKEAFANEHGETGWQLVRKTPVANSTSKTWNEQQALLTSDEETPKAQVMVYTIIGFFLATGERLFEKIYVRCSDLVSDGHRVYVGDFDAKGPGFFEIALKDGSRVNIIIPPALMFFLVLTVRPPKKSNLERVVIETMKIVFSSEKKDTYSVQNLIKRGALLNAFITFFYLATFVISFGFIWWVLQKLQFGFLSKLIFIIFFSLICFAGAKIRERAKELAVEEEKPGFISSLLESFSLPFIRVGKWLSGQWARYSIVVVILTALIDMPFQLFTEFLEQWRYFLKEKKEEIH